MQLYYFTGPNHALENITKRRLKISRLNAVNDTFEFIGVALKTRAERLALRKTKDQIGETRGLICFSRDWTHPLMWGHYATNCRGVCFGFKTVGRVTTADVDYYAERPTLETFGIKNLSELTEEHMQRIQRMKFDAWAYEKETRLFCALDDPEDGHYFLNFAPHLKLNKVIVGPDSQITRDQVMTALGDLQGVDVFMARPAFKTFRLVKQRDDRW